MELFFLYLTKDIVIVGQPLLFRALIESFMPDSGVSAEQAQLHATLIALGFLVHSVVGPTIVFRLIYSGLQWQGGTCSLLYRKVSKSNATSAISTTWSAYQA